MHVIFMVVKAYFSTCLPMVWNARRRRRAATACLACALVLSLACRADARNEAECTELVVAGSCTLWPYYFCESPGASPSGVFVDMLDLASRRTGIAVTYCSYPWKRTFHYLDLGRIDAVAGVYSTRERREKYRMSVQVGRVEARVFVKKGKEFPLDSFAGLKGRRGDRRLGSSHGQAFDAYAEEHLDLVEAGSVDALIRRVLNGYSDYFVDSYDAVMQHGARDVLDKLSVLPFVVHEGGLHVAFSKSSLCEGAFHAFDEVFRDLVKQGVVDKMLARYGAASSADQRPHPVKHGPTAGPR